MTVHTQAYPYFETSFTSLEQESLKRINGSNITVDTLVDILFSIIQQLFSAETEYGSHLSLYQCQLVGLLCQQFRIAFDTVHSSCKTEIVFEESDGKNSIFMTREFAQVCQSTNWLDSIVKWLTGNSSQSDEKYRAKTNEVIDFLLRSAVSKITLKDNASILASVKKCCGQIDSLLAEYLPYIEETPKQEEPEELNPGTVMQFQSILAFLHRTGTEASRSEIQKIESFLDYYELSVVWQTNVLHTTDEFRVYPIEGERQEPITLLPCIRNQYQVIVPGEIEIPLS